MASFVGCCCGCLLIGFGRNILLFFEVAEIVQVDEQMDNNIWHEAQKEAQMLAMNEQCKFIPLRSPGIQSLIHLLGHLHDSEFSSFS